MVAASQAPVVGRGMQEPLPPLWGFVLLAQAPAPRGDQRCGRERGEHHIWGPPGSLGIGEPPDPLSGGMERDNTEGLLAVWDRGDPWDSQDPQQP